jgi:hypothetical protein
MKRSRAKLWIREGILGLMIGRLSGIASACAT